MIDRCINLDWLEVCAVEPPEAPHDPDFFRACGFVVHEREYGSKVWGSIFTLEDQHGDSFMEVRRAPKSEIIAFNIVHLRLVNRYCYFEDAPTIMTSFMDTYGYEFHHITRVDICLDFERFDYGDDPKEFLRRYIERKYSKINQGNICSRGADKWEGRDWNSISWGSPTSDIGTKMYNKTLELYDPVTHKYAKPYIRQAWQASGLVTNMTDCTKEDSNGELYTVNVWRVEFSIRSSVRNWFTIEVDGKRKNKRSIRNTLDMYDSKEKLLILFASLTDHYFHFKHLIKRYSFYTDGHTDGNPVRKDRCPDKLLFRWKGQQLLYKVEKQFVSGSQKPNKEFCRLLQQLKEFRATTLQTDIKTSATVLIDYLENRIQVDDMSTSLTRTEIEVLRRTLAEHIRRPHIDPTVLMRIAREELKLRDDLDAFWEPEEASQ